MQILTIKTFEDNLCVYSYLDESEVTTKPTSSTSTKHVFLRSFLSTKRIYETVKEDKE